MVYIFSLTKAIYTKGVQLSSKYQIITLQICKNIIYFWITSFNMVLVSFWVLNYTPFQIILHPLLILWTSTSYTPCLDILILKFWQLLFPNTVSRLEHICPNCAIWKAKQKDLNKFKSNTSTDLAGRINIDNSSVQTTKALYLVTHSRWIHWIPNLWSCFIKAKSDLPA
jgi:hypothetical protein